ncbi:aspartic protein nepenthesin-2-like [Dorcoceras hygrometricum]|uniref:Aspartic protein nepenthesin-2-like n=1 Tax=Dorcoceras hygrometricum TaxID=472368 RepID=A0A2Z7C5E0_9LAMI|nr:aspartic protein nepenthesin-2-like [Dorcoceras hygrometricum]
MSLFDLQDHTPPPSSQKPPPPSPPRAAAAAAVFAGKIVSGQLDEENPFVLISSGLLVQPDEGVSDLVMDRIGQTTISNTGRYYQLTPKPIPLNDATQHSRSKHSAQSNKNIPKLNPTKIPFRISYATQSLIELITPELFSPETAHDKNQCNTKLRSSSQNCSS